MPNQSQPITEDLNQVVTLGMLRNEFLEYMAPLARDHEKLVKNQEKLSQNLEDLETRMNHKFEEFKTEIIAEVKNIVLSSEDKLMGEFKKLHEELAAGQYRQSQHSTQLEDHETRLGTLEDRRKIN